MEYPLESLDPETFQRLCQAILVSEYPDVQCFPVAQPDGGRDAVVFDTPARESFAMYQVKFVRQALTDRDPHKWLLDIMSEEASKIAKQIPNGARNFFLITNVSGTAHPNTGSIDSALAILKDRIGLPVAVWWRDDVMRRIDSSRELKWSFPQLLTGTDVLQALIESDLTEHRDRRASAIRSFVCDQYATDEEVKFKQIELQNKLLDLFIDVPLVPPNATVSRRDRATSVFRKVASGIARELSLEVSRSDQEHRYAARYAPERVSIGSATLLLDDAAQRLLPFVVLEGAPGQGKSTVSQYISQVHRMRLLDRQDVLATIPRSHRSAPVRLPMKADLRDLATWLSRVDPFDVEATNQEPFGWNRSLESFLAALVRHHSGGAQFDVSDLHAVLRRSEVLLVFDGLDEVADIQRRQVVVEEIARGVKRLSEFAPSVQVIVTSRPAAFANSPGLPEEKYTYLQLDDVTRPLIDRYAENWIRARRIDGRQAGEVKRILRDKLGQPHLRDLARNPMQLAILLSLIHTRGSSLPDKRTALYDSYLELFFNREAEKSSIVRDSRDLLIDIHRYLAWVLHAEAERDQSMGAIRKEQLEILIEDFLRKEGHDVTIAKKLFSGMVERVGALVSRVEGFYEFEVQPLREYFAARFLYDTAPYSPPGFERKGTKPDRFDAISRNFYWTNVTRFYAGCYSKGELSSLVDRLQELSKAPGYSRIAYPRVLAATLLSDWVFAQHPRSVKEVVELILDEIGIRYVISSGQNRPNQAGAALILPARNGREELMQHCFRVLSSAPPADYVADLTTLIRSNSTHEEARDMWLSHADEVVQAERTQWLEYGLQLGALARLPDERILALLSDGPLDARRALVLMKARCWTLIEGQEVFFQACLDALLDGTLRVVVRRNAATRLLERFGTVMSAAALGFAFSNSEPLPLNEVLRRHGIHFFGDDEREPIPPYSSAQSCARVADLVEREFLLPARTWATEIGPWDRVVETVRGTWGTRWVLRVLANVAAGIRSAVETCTDHSDLFDEGLSLCRRARYARLRAGNIGWWKLQLASATQSHDMLFCLLLLLAWGSPSTLTALAAELDPILANLDEHHWYLLNQSLQESVGYRRSGAQGLEVVIDIKRLPLRLGPRTASALTIRSVQGTRYELYDAYLKDYNGSDSAVLHACGQIALSLILVASGDSTKLLDVIARSYACGPWYDDPVEYHRFRRSMSLSLSAAERVLAAPVSYPGFLVAMAEAKLSTYTAANSIPVGLVADRENWSFS
jgi:uncharacterized protein YheU (UPF0270 family)